MIQVQNITKTYVTGDLTQVALNNVSIDFRENEFVAILGPSGSGKTTLLNIIGGLDRYDSGDVVINNVSTKEYTDRDWDIYRNHTVGFIFQNYNLIPHQTILSNVELALTIGGLNKKDSLVAAKTALYQVGLASHIHKTPNQLSGGQMQRVAIARALVNDPEVLLADEPTGALDSETSIHIMNLLKNMAKNKLVIMVTHNQELAEKYATRIIRVKDGEIVEDTNPYEAPDTEFIGNTDEQSAFMSFKTALGLSWNNLQTKKARTVLTAFAGSIGIIGISLILALSSGVNKYITNSQRTIMASYPVEVHEESIDLASIATNKLRNTNQHTINFIDNGFYVDNSTLTAASVSQSMTHNNLQDFKVWLDDIDNPIHHYISTNGINYEYDIKYDVYAYDTNGTLVTTNDVIVEKDTEQVSQNVFTLETLTGDSNNIMTQLLADKSGMVDDAIKMQYDIIDGRWPESSNEIVLLLNSNREIPAIVMYDLGLLPASDYQKYVNLLNNDEEIEAPLVQMNFDKVLGHKVYLMVETDKYMKNPDGWFDYYGDTADNISSILMSNSTELTICGIMQAKENTALSMKCVGYTKALTNYMINRISESNIVMSQIKTPEINVLNGYSFIAKNDEEKIAEVKYYFEIMPNWQKAQYARGIIESMYGESDDTNAYLAEMTENDLIKVLDQQLAAMTNEDYLNMYDKNISSGTYEDNMRKFGVINKEKPSSIYIYTSNFDDKNTIINMIQDYNAAVEEDKKIDYTDYISLMLSSITTIINSISYVLIALVSVSLVVSCIMIGIITNISVIERTKEIGVLRAVGASKTNVSNVFNAETFIIGLASGVLGIFISLMLTIPMNKIIYMIVKTSDIKASLPVPSIILLIVISIAITMIGGLYPAKKAANMDPVKALRSE